MVPQALVSVAVVGSGISGLICAQTILQQVPGAKVSVFEWGRGPGGRTARRRVTVNGTGVSFDHAAPFFAASTQTFRDGILKGWADRGLTAQWGGRFATFGESGELLSADAADVWVGVPTMHSICRALSDDVVASGGNMLFGRHVASTKFDGSTWRVSAHNRFAEEGLQHEESTFDALVLSDKLLVLPNQYAVLPQADAGPLSLPPIASEPCVVLLVALDRSRLPSADGACISTWDVLAAHSVTASPGSASKAGSSLPARFIVHQSTKPQRELGEAPDVDLWTVHSGADFAAKHLREEVEGEAPSLVDEDVVKEEMLAEFMRILSRAHLDRNASMRGPEAEAVPLPREAVLFSSVMVVTGEVGGIEKYFAN